MEAKEKTKKKGPDGRGYYYEETDRKGKKVFCWRISLGGRGAENRKTRKAKTAKELDTKVRTLLREIDGNGGKPVDRQKVTTEKRMELWLETSVKPNNAPKTYRSYRQTWENYLAPVVGKVELDKLTPTHLMEVVRAVKAKYGRTGKPLSDRTARYAVDVLLMGVGTKLKAKLLDDDDVRRAMPSSSAVRDRVLTVDEIGEVFGELFRHREIPAKRLRGEVVREARTEAAYRDRYLVAYLLNSGLRISEALGITMDRIDLKEGVIVIDRQLAWVYNDEGERIGHELAKLKTTASERTLPLNGQAIGIIKAQMDLVRMEREAADEGYQMHGLLFPTGTGAPMEARNAFRTLEWVRAAIDKTRRMIDGEDAKPMEKFGLHDLRRSYITHLADAEPRLSYVAMIAGHGNIATTQKHYIWADKLKTREVVQKVGFATPSFVSA